MLKSIWTLALLATAAAGCQALGFTDESTEDMTRFQTRAGARLEGSEGVVVEAIENQLNANPPAVKVTLKNNSTTPFALLSFDVEFGFPSPPGAFAPYIPDFQGVDFEDFKAGESRNIVVVGVGSGTPTFTRILPSTGADARATTGRETDRWGTRNGSVLMNGKVEVVAVDAELESATAPRITFTLENVDRAAADKPIGDLRYTVQFIKNDKILDLPRKFNVFRPVGKTLGKRGERITFEVAGLNEIQDVLGGAKPVLRLK
jgi:hypothetical protein